MKENGLDEEMYMNEVFRKADGLPSKKAKGLKGKFPWTPKTILNIE
jgi:hypothetical protein